MIAALFIAVGLTLLFAHRLRSQKGKPPVVIGVDFATEPSRTVKVYGRKVGRELEFEEQLETLSSRIDQEVDRLQIANRRLMRRELLGNQRNRESELLTILRREQARRQQEA